MEDIDDQLSEALKILEATTNSLHQGNKYYDEQLGIHMIPGVDMAITTLSMSQKINPIAIKLGMELGVYLTLRYMENKHLENLYGDILK